MCSLLCRDFYEELPFDPAYRPLFARIIASIAGNEGRALVHCAAGKDRTGMLVAIILHALGAVWPAIVEDYLHPRLETRLTTPEMVRNQIHAQVPHDEAERDLDALLGIDEAYIAAGVAAIIGRCGLADAYLEESGVPAEALARFRHRLLKR